MFSYNNVPEVELLWFVNSVGDSRILFDSKIDFYFNDVLLVKKKQMVYFIFLKLLL